LTTPTGSRRRRACCGWRWWHGDGAVASTRCVAFRYTRRAGALTKFRRAEHIAQRRKALGSTTAPVLERTLIDHLVWREQQFGLVQQLYTRTMAESIMLTKAMRWKRRLALVQPRYLMPYQLAWKCTRRREGIGHIRTNLSP
jgi:hypothetical protein